MSEHIDVELMVRQIADELKRHIAECRNRPEGNAETLRLSELTVPVVEEIIRFVATEQNRGVDLRPALRVLALGICNGVQDDNAALYLAEHIARHATLSKQGVVPPGVSRKDSEFSEGVFTKGGHA